MSREYIPLFCECGGVISGKLATNFGICIDCKTEYEVIKRSRHE